MFVESDLGLETAVSSQLPPHMADRTQEGDVQASEARSSLEEAQRLLKKILIANRGEIAVRVDPVTCRRRWALGHADRRLLEPGPGRPACPDGR